MIDAIDGRIMNFLQADARLSNAEIARRLDMAPSAVLQRIRRLEERGVVQGYSLRVNPEAVGRALLAFVYVRTSEKLGGGAAARAVAALPEVLELHDIAGEDCYLIKVRVADNAALHAFLRERLARIEHVASTRTVIVLKTFKDGSDLPLPVGADPKRR